MDTVSKTGCRAMQGPAGRLTVLGGCIMFISTARPPGPNGMRFYCCYYCSVPLSFNKTTSKVRSRQASFFFTTPGVIPVFQNQALSSGKPASHNPPHLSPLEQLWDPGTFYKILNETNKKTLVFLAPWGGPPPPGWGQKLVSTL